MKASRDSWPLAALATIQHVKMAARGRTDLEPHP
jgi:hypothetical protein